MTARISAAAASTTCCLYRKLPVVCLRAGSGNGCIFFLRRRDRSPGLRKLTVCFFMEKRNETADHKLRLEKKSGKGGATEELWKNEEDNELPELTLPVAPTNQRQMERSARRKMERYTYLTAAILSSVGITSMAAASVYYRFAWQMEKGGEVPLTEMLGTFALSVGAAVGMEFWARWAHRALWHASMWAMHESHHRPREGPFELNDVFAIINAVPAIALLHFGFFHRGLFPGLCFGAGLGITVYGMAYMFVHDGLVHKRFPVGPIADVPYLRRVASAHQEVEEVGGLEELDKEIRRRMKASNNRSSHVSTKE
ncbi:Beta-carotene 3-hydroxylase [Nymphaea thermarum]|nr:Beta-carotene 3-hydroxylase [Nymphaea thermarum]